MKGQYKIVSEVLLFAMGVAITSFVVISFQNVRDSISEMSIEDQLGAVSNLLSSGIIKAAEIDSIVRLRIPKDVSGMAYKVSLENNNITISTVEKPVFVSKQIFKIGHPYSIKGGIYSSAEYVDIVSSNLSITIKRSLR